MSKEARSCSGSRKHLLLHIFPSVGLRVWKSVLAVLVCLLISLAVRREDMRIYASIAALQCIQPYVGDMKRMARQRLTGTAIGAVYGALLILLEAVALQIHGAAVGYVLIAAFIAPVLVTATRFHVEDAAYFSCVVFLSITVTHVTDPDPWIFVWHRVMETVLGIAVGMGVNSLRLPRHPRRDTLFVLTLDDMLPGDQKTLTPHSRVLLNRMLDDGAMVTLSTSRTPASVREAAGDVRFRLPLIVMDGAAAYDLNQRTYLHACILAEPLTTAAGALFDRYGVHYFINGLMNNVLITYYGTFHNEAERDVFNRFRVSPYRNYVERKFYRPSAVLYLMAVDRTETMEPLAAALRSELGGRVKLLFYPSADYPGCSYVKVYAPGASQEAMLELLKADLGVERVVTVDASGGEEGAAAHRSDGNRAVHLLERMYEPYFWERSRRDK